MDSPRPFVLLDRDGTLIEERYYLSDPDGVQLLPGAADALCEFRALGFGIAVVGNQAGVGRGYFSEAEVAAVNERMIRLLKNEGATLDGIYICAHAPSDGCACRKPGLGLFQRAMAEHCFLPAESFMIGDKVIDIEFGKNAGVRTILVRTGYGASVEAAGAVKPDYIVDNLAEAAVKIRERVRAVDTAV